MRCHTVLRHVGYVIVFIRDMEAMLEFWRHKVGLRARYTSGEWSELELDNVILALHKAAETSPRDTGIVFKVDDLDKTVERLKEKGVDVTNPQDIGVGREALFRDPEENIYHIFQPTRDA